MTNTDVITLLTRINDPSVGIEFFKDYVTIYDKDINAEVSINLINLELSYKFNSTSTITEEAMEWLTNIANGVRSLLKPWSLEEKE